MEDLAKLNDKILTYQLDGSTLGNLGYKRILLQVCGPAGHGKSSLINSFKYALHGGKFSESAPVAPAETSHGGFTMVRLPYELTEVITLVDNRGFGKIDNFEKEEVYAQLANLQPLNEEFVTFHRSFTDRMKAVIHAKVNTCDLLVPIFVHSVDIQFVKEEKEEILEFLETAHKITGFLPVIVLTKKLSGNAEIMHKQFAEMDMEKIYEVENYTKENNGKTPGKDKTFLTILSEILDVVDFVAKNVVPNLDTPEEEHKKRMEILLEIANKNDAVRSIMKANKERIESAPPKKKDKCVLL
ncbi:uncharacterized protein RB166_015571 [Leptodactylus fuscus]|uniref:uncharacterized protein LOC142217736 n=1 Tax=Leptodactylus fuscus TaxID=238119 RepID=UPI003F4E9317